MATEARSRFYRTLRIIEAAAITVALCCVTSLVVALVLVVRS